MTVDRIHRIAAVVLLGLAASGAAQALQRSVWDGVFTAGQSIRGRVQYDAHCAICHGATLSGSDTAPELSGGLFVANWSELSAGDLFKRIRTTMPANDPGSLGDAAVADVMAYLFMMNKFPAGGAELPRDVQLLEQIRISAAAH